ncbi:AcrR family transcriptional regulator [Rhodococcus sp. PvR044]|jgi:AcrR family transcriptional regulator|uniref:TetR/AcrR family transcriptional regulator n=1 Tax=Rhodococcus TaxID=1827 RepID=UPI001AE48359|nr:MULTISPECIES: TetR family transcriptional regulator [Rhodococcus]MBP1160872.1 AcrR family transcriptional regulator [Rhodococcus sp. PvR099]MCZ4557338.1 TetR family transcriptional regulator [Rhodococcus maanshanensis]
MSSTSVGNTGPTRARNAEQTRADILAAARARFAADGFDRTTLRAVAADVGIDPALVIRYFGSKKDLFAAAAHVTLDFPDLRGVRPDRLAEVLLPRFFAVWEGQSTFLALLRSAMTSDSAAATMRAVFVTQVTPALSVVTPDEPARRIGMVGSFIIGLATARYVLATPGIAEAGHAEITRWAGPVIEHLLTGPAPDERTDEITTRPR